MKTADDQMLKQDVLGRVRMPREQRERILDEFENSGLPGTQFAKRHGLNYQTFASWVQKRRRARSEYAASLPSSNSDTPPPPALTEVFLSLPSDHKDQSISSAGTIASLTEPPPLRIDLPGGTTLQLENTSQVPLVIELIQSLAPPNPPVSC